MGTASRLLSVLLNALRPSITAASRQATLRSSAPSRTTEEIEPPGPRGLALSYAPERDSAPDGGEIVWTWVPYEERDGRGKDRPVLVIGRRDAASSYAVRLTSKPHQGDRDFLALGTGDWDPQGRPSWVDIEQVYLVPDAAMRREAAALDRRRFDAVASALHSRYGWRLS
mgnify:CR=1 FL=1